MALPPLALILGAALIHASWNLLAKKSGGDTRFVLLTGIALCVIWAPLGLWFSWRDAGSFRLLEWALICASGALHLVYYIVLLRGYRHGDLSVVYPLARGSGPLLTALVATTLLDESLRLTGWLGVFGIVTGIVLIAGGGALLQTFAAHDDAGSMRLRAGVRYGLLTGLFIAMYSVIDGYAVKHANVSPILVDYLGNLARLPLTVLLLLYMSRRKDLQMRAYARQMWRPALLVGLISPISYVMVLYAATMAPLSQVAPMREVSLLFAALLGGRLLRERDAGSRLAGAACIAAGVVTLSLA